MMKEKEIEPEKPEKPGNSSNPSTVIDTYAGLRKYLAGFRAGKINLLVLVGTCGIGKSRLVREYIGDKGGWIEGSSTAFGIYSTLYNHRDQPIVIDDVDSIYSDPKSVSLLKSICHTELEKRVSWNARSSFLAGEGLPINFISKSRVLIISNQWRTLNRNVAALEDRGQVVSFEPTPREVHNQAAGWFKDKEIYDWFGEQLRRIETHSFRSYVRAAELKECGIPWKKDVAVGTKRSRREALALDILNDNSFLGNEDRARAFERRGGGCRGTFFNYKRKLEEELAHPESPGR